MIRRLLFAGWLTWSVCVLVGEAGAVEVNLGRVLLLIGGPLALFYVVRWCFSPTYRRYRG